MVMIYKKILENLFPEISMEKILLSLSILGKKADSGDSIAKNILANYAFLTKIPQTKQHAFRLLANSVNEGDTQLIPYFDYYINWILKIYKQINHLERFLAQLKMPAIQETISMNLYIWFVMVEISIKGKFNILGKKCYPELMQIACSSYIPFQLTVEANALLSCDDKQTYFAIADGIPTQNELFLNDLVQWQNNDKKIMLEKVFFAESYEQINSALDFFAKLAESGDSISKHILESSFFCSQNASKALYLLKNSLTEADTTFITYFDFYLNWILGLYKSIKKFEDFLFSFEMPGMKRGFSRYLEISELSCARISIEYKLRILGKKFYPELVQIACTPHIPLSIRANAIKSLSLHSKQKFDENLGNPDSWKENQLRVNDLLDWEKAGYPEGKGYAKPEQDLALENPMTPLEIICAKLQRQLNEQRQFYPADPANPRNLFIVADKKDIEMINQKWQLPSLYAAFLQRFSPLSIDAYICPRSGNPLDLFNASDLLKSQLEYDPIPENYVVIGGSGPIMYVIDLSKSDGVDAPIMQGDAEEKVPVFSLYADSFLAFLEMLTIE